MAAVGEREGMFKVEEILALTFKKIKLIYVIFRELIFIAENLTAAVLVRVPLQTEPLNFV